MDERVILFQGDSITDAGRSKEDLENPYCSLGIGYVNYIAGELGVKKPGIRILNRGIGGDRIADMFGRWQEDALNINYDLISILNGINDIGFSIRKGRGSDVKRFQFIYELMLNEAIEAHPDAKIILGQPFLLKKDLTSLGLENDIYENWDLWDSEMKRRQEVVLELSQKYHTMYAPFADRLNETANEIGAENLTIDCIHLKPAGNYVLAKCWLDVAKEFLGI